MSTVKTDDVTNAAGSGAPDHSNGLKVAGGTTMAAFVEGSYTPTISDLTNITSVTTGTWYYVRVGNFVTVFGTPDVAISGTGNIIFEATLPIARSTNFGTTGKVGGSCINMDSTADVQMGVRPKNGSTTEVIVQGVAGATGTLAHSVYFTYYID